MVFLHMWKSHSSLQIDKKIGKHVSKSWLRTTVFGYNGISNINVRHMQGVRQSSYAVDVNMDAVDVNMDASLQHYGRSH